MVTGPGWRVEIRQLGVASSLPAAPIPHERKQAVAGWGVRTRALAAVSAWLAAFRPGTRLSVVHRTELSGPERRRRSLPVVLRYSGGFGGAGFAALDRGPPTPPLA